MECGEKIKARKQVGFIFLQGVPEGVSIEKIKTELLSLHHVKSLHHIHIWSLEGEQNVFSTHLRLENIQRFSQIMEVKKQAKEILKKYPFEHYTIETKMDEEKCELE